MVENFARLHNDQFDNDLHFVHILKGNKNKLLRNAQFHPRFQYGVNVFVVNSPYLVGNLAEIPHRLQNPLGNC